MRAVLTVVLVFLAGCGTTAKEDPASPPPLDREAVIESAANELEENGSPVAEEFLAASGTEARPWLVRLLQSDDPAVRQRAQALLLQSGVELSLTAEEQVGLILFDLTRDEPHPFASLRALDRLDTMGAEAEPALRRAADGGGTRAEVARRLLVHLREKR